MEELVDGIRGIRGNLENRPGSGFEDFTAFRQFHYPPNYFRDNTTTSDYYLCRFPARGIGSRVLLARLTNKKSGVGVIGVALLIIRSCILMYIIKTHFGNVYIFFFKHSFTRKILRNELLSKCNLLSVIRAFSIRLSLYENRIFQEEEWRQTIINSIND